MNKFILFVMLGCMTLLLSSCTKTCACEDRNNNHKELEIDPAQSCTAYSDDVWSCS
jgi:hypothetical protein